MALMSLGVSQGDAITVVVEGPDEGHRRFTAGKVFSKVKFFLTESQREVQLYDPGSNF